MATPGSAPTITIDVIKDLASTSALKKLLTSQQEAVFTILGTLAAYSQKTIQEAAATSPSAQVHLTGSPSWTTPNGIGFSLTPEAKCLIRIGNCGKSFPVAMCLDDSTQTKNVCAGPADGMMYIDLEIDFTISGSVSGSGTWSGIGIAGKACGSQETTVTYSHPVSASTMTLEALKQAFSGLVFPLDPQCAATMPAGSLVKASFDGAFNCELDVTYGLGDHKVCAPSLATVEESLKNVVQVTQAAVDASVGIKGSISYNHTDHFALIVRKPSATAATLFLVRSSENDWGGSVGISAGVRTTASNITLDPTQLQPVVTKYTNDIIGATVIKAACSGSDKLTSGLNAKLNGWASDVSGSTSLTACLSRQRGHTALFAFDVDLTQANLAAQSWTALMDGDIHKALSLKGFTLQLGSGVSDSLQRSAKLQFAFFNLFAFTSTTSYFSNAYGELGPDGTIRVFQDLGDEKDATTKRALDKFRIHFTATATQDALGNFSNAKVDLCIELSEKNDLKEAAKLAKTVAMLPANDAVQKAQTAMSEYVAAHPGGALNVNVTVKPTAYQKLACTPYNGNLPTPLPHPQDMNNWIAFQNATEKLAPEIGFVPQLSFNNWVTFNQISNDGMDSTNPPDRRHSGNFGAVPNSFFHDLGITAGALAGYFLLASAGFMNLCEDLQILSAGAANVVTSAQWKNLLQTLTQIITKDFYMDYAKPTAGALLQQCSVSGESVSAVTSVTPDSGCMTCAVTIA
ncbi:MAG TPA: hypothetical protein VGN16_18260 [Acidobacteriaceae bacterium]|jgi:hypothetical protein